MPVGNQLRIIHPYQTMLADFSYSIVLLGRGEEEEEEVEGGVATDLVKVSLNSTLTAVRGADFSRLLNVIGNIFEVEGDTIVF
ncbi:hypothetical protein ECG_07823 [Echinococcus granulosus]|uniref:Uncharacterized protein n=1 Tax=Echinococcus granulosus TaxID=6210 RepID=U6JDV4_ECHGR|nr:hypothetical protein EGR_10710 [Echinococcus granulosus]EUB54434.1 hypothetical protein EGR_10710 [Echinococcus granulosus]KAH9279493.1 hypothetical protein ECG_07823 [Echinococcus granulosus]CDS22276.1 hypothetical protein EgrG_002026900 [Echinococcus granulosus]CDS22282.1 hypothetical protein EgrG_002027200 [Echinococcus granulosus]